MIIAVDFDGTVVTHEYPLVGKDVGAVPVLKDLIAAGHKIILNTMRSYTPGGTAPDGPLADAICWFEQHGIELYGVNSNPTQHTWTTSPKTYANIYIDDAALGCPLIHGQHERPYVDWEACRRLLLPS